MMFLVGEISLFLLVAVILGFVIGWFLKRYYMKQDFIRQAKIWKANLYSKDEELAQVRDELEACKASLKAQKA